MVRTSRSYFFVGLAATASLVCVSIVRAYCHVERYVYRPVVDLFIYVGAVLFGNVDPKPAASRRAMLDTFARMATRRNMAMARFAY